MTDVAKSGRESGNGGKAPFKRPSLILGAAHLAALWALTFAQPMLDLLGENPDFFVARGNSSGQIILYALVLTFAVPLVCLAIEALVRLASRDAQWYLHLFLVGLFGACFVLQLIKNHLDWPAGILIAISIGLAVAGVFIYSRWRFPQAFMDVLSVAPIIILVIFFGFSSTSRLVLPREQPDPVDVKIGTPAPVVMVVFDEFPVGSLMKPDGQIDGTRYPAFAELAGHSTWYRNTSAAAAYTPLAVPAIFSGQKPNNDDLPIASDYPHSVFTLLGKTYDLRVMEAATRICPDTLCPEEDNTAQDGSTSDLFSDLYVVSKYLLLPDSLTRNLPDVSNSFSGFTESDQVDTNAESEVTGLDDGGETGATGTTGLTGATGATGDTQPERTGQGAARKLGRLFALESSADEFERVGEFNAKLKRGQQETLDLIHIEKPHYPWRHIPNGQRYSNLTAEWSGLLPNDGPWMAPPRIVNIAMQRHLLEVGYTDTLLAQIIKRLKQTGLWERAMVVVTADHGAAFQSKVPRRAATSENMGEVASVPLFIKSPGQVKPEVTDRRTCATDILPMIADQLGIEYPWPVAECDPERVTVVNSPNGEGFTSPAKMLRQRQKLLINRIQSVFGTGHGWGPYYRFGPHRELIGKKVKNLEVLPLKRWRALPDERNAAKNYDPTAPTLRGLLQRGVTDRIPEGSVLAVAVDGKIQAVGWTFKDGTGRGPGFSILLPPESLRAGFNRIAIYLLRDNGKKLRLVYDGSRPLAPELVEAQNEARAEYRREMGLPALPDPLSTGGQNGDGS
ncbi:MAG TPA: sulfatase-like hydrolase/transferase [Solirubrobacterales bacterium]|nr:sulfatase-like hydrolase/transferase [Solirubrobacterales bacterium]HMU25978.1 sulfatase-like hydrolase/transferase [Solirubrobacterales bacterium]HMX70779.1 sulfatase-like hydrolase/transferase [Solirubrobacterales bacterium]HNA24394.1 sulfatase-like hydrolase/transferase [Solirubrobacterales bacterium]HNA43645.1 sulfatase-like hydrolase/transferase [Solirubrobacterales bacterium]